MKTKFLLFILTVTSSMVFSQGGEFRILPEGGISLPTGDFKSKYTFGSQGYLAGLNLDMFWGNFGVGLFGGMNNNGIDYQDDLPPVGGLIISKPSSINRDSWKQLLVGVGPIYKIGLTETLDLEFSFKVGFSKFAYPDYAESIETGAPLNQGYLIYETRHQDIKDKLNLATIPAMRISYKPSDKLAISLGANYTSAMGVQHSYSFLDGDFNPDMSDEQLAAALRIAPTETDVYKCTFNSIGIILGVGFTFGGKGKPKEEPDEDQSMEPPIPQYPEDGATITPEEADSLVLEWVKETPNVEGANYNFWLYEVRDSTRKNDSLIYKTKVEKSLKLLLPEHIKLKPDSTYRYEVQAVDDRRLKPCPGDCYSVDAMFTVSNVIQNQYYHLLTQNTGTFIEMEGRLNFIIPSSLRTGGKVEARIHNDSGEVVMLLENLDISTNAENYSVDDHGVVSIPINRFKPGYYILEVRNERNRDYYLRFLIASPNATDKE